MFSLVGAEVDISVAFHSGLVGALIIFLGLIARSIGTYLCVIKTGFNFREKMFIVIFGEEHPLISMVRSKISNL